MIPQVRESIAGVNMYGAPVDLSFKHISSLAGSTLCLYHIPFQSLLMVLYTIIYFLYYQQYYSSVRDF